jgi:tetratricopeptide (TPR) repeat protein
MSSLDAPPDRVTVAAEAAASVAHRSEEVRALLNAGLRYLTHERVAEGLDAFERAVVLAPDDADAHAFLAVSLFAVARPDDAGLAIDRALTLAPDGFWPNLKAGELRDRLGDLDSAEVRFLRALRAVEPGTRESAAAAAALARVRTQRAKSIRHGAVLPSWRPRFLRRGAAAIRAPVGEG